MKLVNALFSLLLAVFMVSVTVSAVDYDPWSDITPNYPDGDGYNGIDDIVHTASNFGGSGTPINKSALIILLNSTVPIGSIIAWAKNLPGVPPLPDNFVECNGQTLFDTESPLNGQTIPNLNGQYRYLRGALTSGGIGGSETHSHDMVGGSGNRLIAMSAGHIVVSGDPGHPSYASQYTEPASTLPSFYSVVWVLRIK